MQPPVSLTTDRHPDVRVFEAHRHLLFSIAYRILGSATEAEDVVQEAWLRYASAPAQVLRSARAWLGTIVTRLCLDRLKAARTTREQYVGQWLPEPVLDGDREPSLARAVEQRDSIGLAFMVLLESLTPQERAVFLLREVFDYEYRDISEMLELRASNCRQLFHRAKARIAEQQAQRSATWRRAATPDRHAELVQAFMHAVSHGDVDALRAALAEDVRLRADGGGKVRAAPEVMAGRDLVARLLLAYKGKTDTAAATAAAPHAMDLSLTAARVNGTPAVLVWVGDTLDSVIAFDASDAGIREIDLVRNPDKLTYLRRQLERRASR